MSSIRNQAIVYFNNANELYKLENYQNALENYQKTIDYDHTFVFAYLWKSKTLLQLEKYDEGISYFTKNIELFHKSKQADYTLQLSEILLKKGVLEKPLALITQLNIAFSEKHLFDYLRILLVSKKEDQAILKIINSSSNSTTILNTYQRLLKDPLVPVEVINQLEQENSVPRFFGIQNKVAIFKSIKNENKEYQKLIKEIPSLITALQKNTVVDISRITEIENRLKKLQEILLVHGTTLLKTNNINKAEAIYNSLINTGYDVKKTAVLAQEIAKSKRSKNKKTTKLSITILLVITVIVTAGYFINSSIQKSKTYQYAIKTDKVFAYNSYLYKYGDDKEIHRLREIKLYKNAKHDNTTKAINAFVNAYPNSKYFKTVSVKTTQENNPNINLFGAQSENNYLRETDSNTFKIPLGCTIGYSILENEKIPIKKFFTVAKNMSITETLRNEKTLLFRDDFNSNKNKWTVFEESKEVYRRTKHKGVKIDGGSLELYNQFNDNKFVISTKYLSKLKRNINFQIIATIQRKGNDDGTFLLFGATKRAFNYIGFSDRSNYSYGYNNWDSTDQNWIKQSHGWERNNTIANGNYATNRIEIIKQRNTLQFKINDSFIGSTTLKKWYGNRIGFGVNDKTSSQIHQMSVYQLNSYQSPKFIKNNLYFCSVKELNVREGASTKNKVKTTIKIGEPIRYLGEVGKKRVNATFNEVFSPDYYYRVELLDGTTGWVHGGGLKDLNTQELLQLSEFKK